MQVVLRALFYICEEIKKIQKPKKRMKMVKEVLNTLLTIVKNDMSHIEQILEFDLKDLLEIALSGDDYEAIIPAIKFLGQLMASEDY